MKYIFVTGGVVSSLGKGLAAASIGTLLERCGLKVTLQKFDPYLNVDPGTMSPFQHGEVYVLNDGAETDLDLGHYERFVHCTFSYLLRFRSPPRRSCRLADITGKSGSSEDYPDKNNFYGQTYSTA